MNFKCPFCSQPTTITDPNMDTEWYKFRIKESEHGHVGLAIVAITCPNSDCNQLSLSIALKKALLIGGRWEEGENEREWRLLPESEATVLPDYVPGVIREDYYESCRIRDLSPKASATLSRRCLQGMIRDFYGIIKGSLKDEIDELEDVVDPLVWQAIDVVRKIGNIGAHMGKDINLIIEVEPDEAQLLIGLIEQLIDDWYIDRHNKQAKLKQITALAERKDEEKKKKMESAESGGE